MVSIPKTKSRSSRSLHDVTSCRIGGLEFKEARHMPRLSLPQLDGSRIEVVVDIGGSCRSLQGIGQFEAGDPDLGRVLRVLVTDDSGDFELLFPESDWDGACEPSSMPGCRFKLHLGKSSSCSS